MQIKHTGMASILLETKMLVYVKFDDHKVLQRDRPLPRISTTAPRKRASQETTRRGKNVRKCSTYADINGSQCAAGSTTLVVVHRWHNECREPEDDLDDAEHHVRLERPPLG